MAKAKLNQQLKKTFFATCVCQNGIELGAVLNNIGVHKTIQVISHLKPRATGHLSTSVTSSINQTDEIKLLIPFSGVNL